MHGKKKDIIALGTLLAVPALAIGITAALGYHAMLTGDNQIQNLPLRVLAGRDIAAGHLPLWNPFNWSGTPLLASFNSGAIYPPILIFATFPPMTAWALTWILTYWICISGTYLLCRKLGISPLPSALGTATFSFAGTMILQIAHLQVMEGDAWIPWILLGIEGLAASTRGRRLHTDRAGKVSSGTNIAAWTALSAVSIAMTVLSGSTSAMAAAGIVAGIVILWHTLRVREWDRSRDRMLFLASSIVATLWGFGLSSIQVLTGLSFVGISQRGNGSTAYAFGSYSVPFAKWLFLLLPGIAGGSGNFRLPKSVLFIADNATYFGLLPLVAFFALLAISLGKHRDAVARRWIMWIVVAVVGAVLAMGSALPGGSILSRIPFYGGLRVQARNIVITDLAVAVILGFWLDRIVNLRSPSTTGSSPAKVSDGASEIPDQGTYPGGNGDQQDGAPGNQPDLTHAGYVSNPEPYHHRPLRKELVAGAIPMLASATLAIIGLADPTILEHTLSITGTPARVGRTMWPSVLETFVLAILALAFALRWPKLRSRSIWAMITAFVAADLGFFAIVIAPGFHFSGVNSIVPRASGFEFLSSHTHASGSAWTGSRYALFDPNFANFTSALRHAQVDENVLAGISSIQGYGSVVWGQYDAATCTHAYDSMRVAALASSVSNELDLGTLLAAQDNFANPVGSNETTPAPTGDSHVPCSPSAYTSIPAPSGSNNGSGAVTAYTTGATNRTSTIYTAGMNSTSVPSFKTSTTGKPATQVHGKTTSKEWYIGSPVAVSQVTVALPATVQNILGYLHSSRPAASLHTSHIAPGRHKAIPHRTTRSLGIRIELLAPPDVADLPGHVSAALSIAGSSYATTSGRRGKMIIYKATFPAPTSTVAVRITGPAARYVSPQNITIRASSGTHHGSTLILDGPLVNAVKPGKWVYTGTFGGFLSFHNTDTYGHLWLAPLTGNVSSNGSIPPPTRLSHGDKLSIQRITQAGNEVDHVTSTSPALLVRSMAWAPGWTATITQANGRKVTENVSRFGLVQAVPIPKGSSTVSFSYWPPGMTQGAVLTLLSILALLAVFLAYVRHRLILRRARRVPLQASRG
ncbi:MAG: YfhO family protein [Actinobacteria bacterium]|nr:YfhO family protein [Actinomycetota bacterium]MCL5446118.1 YfhO family protein [Actinomycetota bacterium]